MFYAVHAQTAGEHENQHNKNRGDDLISFSYKNSCDYVERVIFGIQTEQVENSCHAQHTENDKPGQEKSRNDREQIHNTVKRNEETDRGSGLAHSRIVIKISKARLRRLLLSPI